MGALLRHAAAALVTLWCVTSLADGFLLDSILKSAESHSNITECHKFPEYIDLVTVWDVDPCMPATRVWALLKNLSRASMPCLAVGIYDISESVRSHNVSCSCQGNIFPGFHAHVLSYIDFSCSATSSHYVDIQTYFTKPDCGTHVDIWRDLRKMEGNVVSVLYACILKIIGYLSDAFDEGHMDNCTCTEIKNNAATTAAAITTSVNATTTSARAPTTPTATTTTSKTTTSVSATAPTTSAAVSVASFTVAPLVSIVAPAVSLSPGHYGHCSKLWTIQDIAQRHMSTNNATPQCPSGTYTSSEAFVVNHCNIDIPRTWTPGVNVMSSCDRITTFTPIATFTHAHYSTTGQAAVFLGCLPNGFKVAVQHCDQTSSVEHIVVGVSTTGTVAGDPYMYYTIG